MKEQRDLLKSERTRVRKELKATMKRRARIMRSTKKLNDDDILFLLLERGVSGRGGSNAEGQGDGAKPSA